MPKSTRDWAQRKLEHSTGNINWALDKIVDVAETYREKHPEIAGPLDEVIAGLVVFRDVILRIRASF